MDLVKIDNQALSLSEQRIITAMQGAKLKNIDTEIALDKIADLLTATTVRLSYDTKEADIKTHTLDFYGLMQRNYQGVTLDEIKIAFENGSLGKYGEFRGLGSATLFKWIKAYRDTDQERKKALRTLPKLSPPKKDLSNEEKDKIMFDSLFRKYQEFFKTGTCNDFGNGVYDYFDKKGVINLSVEVKNKIMPLARANASEKVRSSKIVTHQLVKQIEDIKNNSKSEKVIDEAKRLALLEFFKQFKTVEDLKKIVENDYRDQKKQ